MSEYDEFKSTLEGLRRSFHRLIADDQIKIPTFQ